MSISRFSSLALSHPHGGISITLLGFSRDSIHAYRYTVSTVEPCREGRSGGGGFTKRRDPMVQSSVIDSFPPSPPAPLPPAGEGSASFALGNVFHHPNQSHLHRSASTRGPEFTYIPGVQFQSYRPKFLETTCQRISASMFM